MLKGNPKGISGNYLSPLGVQKKDISATLQSLPTGPIQRGLEYVCNAGLVVKSPKRC